jgi:16S rRNA (cytosine967-C5)-methyltransferase
MPSTFDAQLNDPVEQAGLAARRAALTMLDAVLRRGQTLDAAAQNATNRLPPPDRALAIAIAGETLRRLPDLDLLIDSATQRALPEDSKARAVLRLALAQKLTLNVPDHALVATALPLVDGGPRRLVHGVLGTLLRRGLPPLDAPNLPEQVHHRWTAAWGDDVVEAARRQIATRPALDLTFADATAATAFAADNDGVQLGTRHVRLTTPGAIPDLPGFDSGAWWVQDLAATLPARLMPAAASDILDVCSAPGGKTLQLAAAGHRVSALDKSQSRLKRLSENLKRTHLSAKLITADALTYADRTFDGVLLDAPCSSTGTFRRHPEVLYRASPKIIAAGAELQRALLARAATLVRPGGTLIYAVCSIEPPEGEEVIEHFLSTAPDFTLAPPSEADPDWPAEIPADPKGWVRILPGLLEAQGGLDGFFLARMRRA